jgi:heterodisulfide reductase subunit A-like polyferredoxin
MQVLDQLLKEAGIGRYRLQLRWVSSAAGQLFADYITELTGVIRETGPPDRTRPRVSLTAVEKALQTMQLRWLMNTERQLTEKENVFHEKLNTEAYEAALRRIAGEEYQKALLAELCKIPLNAEGFFTEAHVKINPVEATTEGIYLAGLSHYPKPLQESVAEAMAAASRAATVLSRDFLELESTISRVVDQNCDGCAFCVDACHFQAFIFLEYMFEGKMKKTVEVNEIACKGCGSCMATCPKQGIYVAGFSLEQLEAQVDAALGLA